MPTIAFVCGKGGVGKTTSALLLATALAKLYDVTLIDADPNQPIKSWAEGGNTPERMTIVSDITERSINDAIEDAASKTPFVLVDLEGTASKIVLYAIEQADFIVVPMQASPLDAKEASKAISVIHEVGAQSGERKPHAILFTRTSLTIRTRSLIHIQRSLAAAGVPMLETELNEREAFRSIIAFQQTLDGLRSAETPNLDNAQKNVLKLAEEIFERLAAEQGGKKKDRASEARGAA